MVRLCSKRSRPYSGRPAIAACRQRRSVMPAERLQESAEAVVPRVTSREHPEGLTTREGLNLAGRTRPSVVLSRSDEADWLSCRAAIIVAEKECCFYPQGLPGTAGRGPACPVVWEAGGEIPPPTRLGLICDPLLKVQRVRKCRASPPSKLRRPRTRPQVAIRRTGLMVKDETCSLLRLRNEALGSRSQEWLLARAVVLWP